MLGYMIDAILVGVGGAAAIFWLRMAASLCSAKMDTVTSHYSDSIYKDKIRQWYDPSVSWTNKNDYPENVETWRELAASFLPKWMYVIINKIKPAYDPFSDFWHYEKFSWLMLDLFAAIVWAGTIRLTCLFSLSFTTFVISMSLCAAAWSFAWLLSFDAHLKELRD